MKNIFLILLLAFSSIATAQKNKSTHFGFKAGLNYGDNGQIETTDFTNARTNVLSQNASDRTGYHIGIFVRQEITSSLFLKPELQYTINKSSFDLNNTKLDYDIQKLDLPILVGMSLIGPLHVFGGPSLQYILENGLENVKLGDVQDEFTVGLQFGVGFRIGRLSGDIRYERGINKNQATAIDNAINQNIRVDSRPNQFLLSIGIEI